MLDLIEAEKGRSEGGEALTGAWRWLEISLMNQNLADLVVGSLTWSAVAGHQLGNV